MYDLSEKEMNCSGVVSCPESCSQHILTDIKDQEVNFRSSGSDVRIREHLPCSDVHCASYEDQFMNSAHPHQQPQPSYHHINSVSVIMNNIWVFHRYNNYFSFRRCKRGSGWFMWIQCKV